MYRGTRLAQLYGHYVFADYGSGNVWALHYDGTRVSQHRRLTVAANIVAFGTDPANGDVLLASLNGPVLRLVYDDVLTGPPLPPTLAETGAFRDLLALEPEAGILPYEINLPFWSDGAEKRRWFSLPSTNTFLGFAPDGSWLTPTGAVWIKHFDLALTEGTPETRRRIETRLLVRNAEGSYGLTYRWDDAQTNAVLVREEGLDEDFLVQTAAGTRTQTWHYPSRAECLVCHTPVAGSALSFNTYQLHRAGELGGLSTNQILALATLGYLTNAPASLDALQAYASPTNTAASLDERVRSYLGANCVQCHQPGGLARGSWDARFATPLAEAGIVEGQVEDLRGDPGARVMAPGSLQHSMLYRRIAEPGPGHMPPLATAVLNTQAIDLLADWIQLDPGVELKPPLRAAPDRLTLRAQGAPHRQYHLQRSADLSTWQPAATLTADAAGTVSHDLLLETAVPARYFRLLWP